MQCNNYTCYNITNYIKTWYLTPKPSIQLHTLLLGLCIALLLKYSECMLSRSPSMSLEFSSSLNRGLTRLLAEPTEGVLLHSKKASTSAISASSSAWEFAKFFFEVWRDGNVVVVVADSKNFLLLSLLMIMLLLMLLLSFLFKCMIVIFLC